MRRASFLGDSGCHGGAHGPSCCGCQLFDFCVKPPDYPLHGFTTLVKKERVSPLERWEEKTPTLPPVVDSSKDFHTKLSYIALILNVAIWWRIIQWLKNGWKSYSQWEKTWIVPQNKEVKWRSFNKGALEKNSLWLPWFLDYTSPPGVELKTCTTNKKKYSKLQWTISGILWDKFLITKSRTNKSIYLNVFSISAHVTMSALIFG